MEGMPAMKGPHTDANTDVTVLLVATDLMGMNEVKALTEEHGLS